MNSHTANVFLPGCLGSVKREVVLLEDAEEMQASLQKLSVTNIMLDVVPGFDGMGEEIYAKSVDDVSQQFGGLVDQIESLEQRLADAERRNEALSHLLYRFVSLQKSDYAVRGGMSTWWQPLIDEANATLSKSEEDKL